MSGSMSTTMTTSAGGGEGDDMDKVLTSYFDKTVNSNTIKVSFSDYFTSIINCSINKNINKAYIHTYRKACMGHIR